MGWSSWVIGFLRAPSVPVNCNNQVKRALLALLVLSTCGFLAAFFATNKGNMMCVYQHTRQWKRQEQMVPDIKQTFEKLLRGVEESFMFSNLIKTVNITIFRLSQPASPHGRQRWPFLPLLNRGLPSNLKLLPSLPARQAGLPHDLPHGWRRAGGRHLWRRG